MKIVQKVNILLQIFYAKNIYHLMRSAAHETTHKQMIREDDQVEAISEMAIKTHVS